MEFFAFIVRENDAKTITEEISKQIGAENMTPAILQIIASNIKKLNSIQKSKPHVTVFDEDTFQFQFRKPEVVKYYTPRFEDFEDESIELDTMGRITSEEKVLELSTKRRRESEGNLEEEPVEDDQLSEVSDNDDLSKSKDALQADVQSLVNFAKKRPKAKSLLRGLQNIKSLAEKKKVLIARLHDAGYSWKGDIPNGQNVGSFVLCTILDTKTCEQKEGKSIKEAKTTEWCTI